MLKCYLSNFKKNRSSADQSPEIMNMTVPAGIMISMRNSITAMPASLPANF